MNRIILIGNGFDKAHGLPTSYDDFFNWLERNAHKDADVKQRMEEIGGRNCIVRYRKTKNDCDDQWLSFMSEDGYDYKLCVRPKSNSIYFESLFDMRENETETGRWSDLERNYFEVLREHKHDKEAISIINKEFEHLKRLLEDYLLTEVEDKVKDGTYPFDEKHHILNKLRENAHNYEKNYFVSFNYTSEILDKYVLNLSRTIQNGWERFGTMPIHIHGALQDSNNPIIFGYGDENSSDYEELEKIQNNELLKNFKTFQYLRTRKYRQVLGLLEENVEKYMKIPNRSCLMSEEYEQEVKRCDKKEGVENYILVIGHSCGMCDKALLRAIFQHPNTKYVEAVYYQKEANDNSQYFENLYNISRIFDDNTLMRERLVPLEKTIKIPPKK